MNTQKTHTTLRTNSTDYLQLAITSVFTCIFLTVPLFFTFTTEELFEFNKMILTYAFTAVILGLWGARMILARKVLFRHTQLDIPILIFVLSQLLSTLFSIHPQTSLFGYYTRFHGGLFSTLSYVALFYAFVTNCELRQLKGMFITLFIGAGIVSLYGILEHHGHSFSCLLASQGQSFGTNCWIQDVQNRVFASFGQPNWLAAYLITLLPLGLFLTHATRSSLQRVLGIICTALLFITLLYTRSRSGFVGFSIAMLVFGALFAYVQWQKDRWKTMLQITRSWGIYGSVAVLVAMSAVIGTPFTPSLSTVLIPASPSAESTAPAPTAVANRLDIGGTDSGEIRKIVWQGAVRVWQRYPLFGSGVETFGYSYYQDRPEAHNLVSEWDFLYNKAHNEFLNYLATTGTVGFLAYCALLGSFAVFTLMRIRRSVVHERYQRALLYSSILAGVVALTVSNFFGFSTVMVSILMFFYFGLSEILEARLLPQITYKRPLHSWQYTAFIVIVSLTLIGVYTVYRYWSADVAYTRAKLLFEQGQLEFGLVEMARAVSRNPEEALFYDTLADQYAQYALAFAGANQPTQAAQLADRAIAASDLTLQLNDRQLNFYKTRARIFINLAQLDPSYLTAAKETLQTAHKLAPTDPKLVYNLGLIEIWQGNSAAGIELFTQALELKPNYELVRIQLAQEYQRQGKATEAAEQALFILEQLNPSNELAAAILASATAEQNQEITE